MANNPYQWGGTPQTGNTYNYYDPSSSYGGTRYGQGEFAQTPIGKNYLEADQEASFTRWLADNGYRDFTGEGEFARQQFGRMRTGYDAAVATNPELSFQNYLGQTGGQLANQYTRLTPDQRGEKPSMYAPRARYIPR